MRRLLVAGAVALVALVGVGVYVLTRPSGDIDVGGGYGTIAWDGAREVNEEPFGTTYFAGNGTVVALLMASNMRDHAVRLAVPEAERARLAARGIRAGVVFVPRKKILMDVERSDLDRAGATTMPANALDGTLVHIFRVTDCKRAAKLQIDALPLTTDGHDALVGSSVEGVEDELFPYATEAIRPLETLQFEGC